MSDITGLGPADGRRRCGQHGLGTSDRPQPRPNVEPTSVAGRLVSGIGRSGSFTELRVRSWYLRSTSPCRRSKTPPSWFRPRPSVWGTGGCCERSVEPVGLRLLARLSVEAADCCWPRCERSRGELRLRCDLRRCLRSIATCSTPIRSSDRFLCHCRPLAPLRQLCRSRLEALVDRGCRRGNAGRTRWGSERSCSQRRRYRGQGTLIMVDTEGNWRMWVCHPSRHPGCRGSHVDGLPRARTESPGRWSGMSSGPG